MMSYIDVKKLESCFNKQQSLNDKILAQFKEILSKNRPQNNRRKSQVKGFKLVKEIPLKRLENKEEYSKILGILVC